MVKQMVKLVVSDFDGTLLPYGEERLSDKVIAGINKILNMGIVFAVSSGRTYSELLNYLSDYRDKIYYSCCDGAVTVKNGKVIYSRKIELSDMELFFKNAETAMVREKILEGVWGDNYYGDVKIVDTDTSDLEAEAKEYYAGDFLTEEAVFEYYFNPHNTSVVIEDGVVTSMKKVESKYQPRKL